MLRIRFTVLHATRLNYRCIRSRRRPMSLLTAGFVALQITSGLQHQLLFQRRRILRIRIRSSTLFRHTLQLTTGLVIHIQPNHIDDNIHPAFTNLLSYLTYWGRSAGINTVRDQNNLPRTLAGQFFLRLL